MYMLVGFNIFTRVCNHYHCLIPENFISLHYHPKSVIKNFITKKKKKFITTTLKSLYPLGVTSHSSLSPANHQSTFCCLFQTFHLNGLVWYVTSFTSSVFKVHVYCSIYQYCILFVITSHCADISHFVNYSVSRHLNCFCSSYYDSGYCEHSCTRFHMSA